MRATARPTILALLILSTVVVRPDIGEIASGSSVAGRTLPPEIHAVTAHGITAHFGGEKTPVAVDAPLEYGVEALWFTFEGDWRSYVFKPKGKLFFTDWNFDLFSPDGAHVLLLQDHYGPYHVVATDRLKDYLIGRANLITSSPSDEGVAIQPWSTAAVTGFLPGKSSSPWLAAEAAKLLPIDWGKRQH
jgi:hypothetical protein